MLILLAWWCIICTAGSAVLDPALYLSPSPPLVRTQSEVSNLWSQSRMKRDDDLAVIPIVKIKTSQSTTPCKKTSATKEDKTDEIHQTPKTFATATLTRGKPTEEDESMEKSETFWPSLRTTIPRFGMHIPLTFGLTGTYGRYGISGGGVIGSSYASVSDDGSDTGLFNLYGKSALAGSSYGSYSGLPGTRIYGSGGSASWSGWGNGKWGHYGKG